MDDLASPRPAATQLELLKPFVQSVSIVFDTMLGCPATPNVIRPVYCPTELASPVTSLIRLTGDLHGALSLHTSVATSLSVFERMTGCPPEAFDEDVRDAMGELANMAAGFGKRSLAEIGLTIGLPEVYSDQQAVPMEAWNQHFLAGFDSEIGSVILAVGFSPRC